MIPVCEPLIHENEIENVVSCLKSGWISSKGKYVDRFEQEFRHDVAIIRYAKARFSLPEGLKLSIHSGSDKFSLYPIIKTVLAEFSVGIHLKTAGTTWLEELTGLAQAGGDGLMMAKQIYQQALGQIEQLCRPYATVIDIDPTQLPTASEVQGWDSEQFVAAVRHDRTNKAFNPHMRQLLHVAYGVAAQMGKRFLDAVDAYRDTIAVGVRQNLLERHIRQVFPS